MTPAPSAAGLAAPVLAFIEERQMAYQATDALAALDALLTLCEKYDSDRRIAMGAAERFRNRGMADHARAEAAEERVAFLVAEAHGWQPKLEAAEAEERRGRTVTPAPSAADEWGNDR